MKSINALGRFPTIKENDKYLVDDRYLVGLRVCFEICTCHKALVRHSLIGTLSGIFLSRLCLTMKGSRRERGCVQ